MRLFILVAVITQLTFGITGEARAQLTSSVYASGFVNPVAFVQDPVDRTVQYIVEQVGRIRVVRNGSLISTDYLDLRAIVSTGGERGLLGLAFAPDYVTSGRFFVDFTDAAGNTVVARFRRSADPLIADASSRFDLRWGGTGGPAYITQPYANHNGGHLAFGPDGFLYIGLGDGGSGDDPEHRAQDPSELLGKMLRIDVNVPDSHAIGYQVPTDNPFIAGGPVVARHEIWSFGLRNPWRYSFDDPARGGTGALVIGDVGQNRYEEIDYEPSGRGGRNYGWRNREGLHDNVLTRPVAFLPLTDPIHEYDHSIGQAVTGGYVYRGRALGTTFQGRYFFADYVAGRVWSIALTIDPGTGEASASDRLEHTTALGGVGNVSAFGLDADGELYIVSYSQGAILKVLGTPVAPAITAQPSSQSVSSGQDAQFMVAATGTPVPGYQWQRSTDAGASWVDLTEAAPYSGTTTAKLAVTNTTVGLSGMQFRCVARSSAGSATSNAATLSVAQGSLPTMTLSHAALHFAAIYPPTTAQLQTSDQTITLSQSDPGTVTWVVTASQNWVRVSPASGTGSGVLTVTVDRFLAGFSGLLSATITVTTTGAANSPTAVVTLNVMRPDGDRAPFGAFDTPADGSSAAGSIAVTGWALDDVEVDRVEIWRDKVAGETTPAYPGPGPGTGKVFIAFATFVNGARPDVEAAYQGNPLTYRAGWGYLLLTWGLWQQGNGPYTLYAFGYDRNGHSATLGTKSITVANATAVKPFGALDTPSFGQTVSGSFWNYGWALTPNATPSCTIAPTGVQMAIDSGTLLPVTYGGNRTDIASAFPGFTNGAAGGGAYYVDTTALANGAHQIGWFVTDGCGRQDGIGSRFFTVLNGSTNVPVSAAPTTAAPMTAASVAVAGSSPGDDRDPRWAPVAVRRGAEVTLVYPNPSGDRVVPVGQSERVEVQLPAIDGATYVGYQVVNGARRALPLGSSLDAVNGIFYWQPAAGFLGAHDLEFVPRSGEGVMHVRAIVGTAVQMAIDTPQAGAVSSSFTIAGWAIDQAATSGTGIDTVHVWAYPATGAAPIFLGVAAYGDARPDIGALFGDQFSRASYSLEVDHLAPGTYDVVVYPHSAVTGDFHGAKATRVTVP